MNSHGLNERKWKRFCNWHGTALLLLALLCGGCVFSLNPWYTGSGGGDPQLLGSWQDHDDGELWVFNQTGDSLSLLLRSDGKAGSFRAATVRHGDFQFLDLFPGEELGGNDFLVSHHQPVHSLFRYAVTGDTLTIESMELNRMKQLWKRGIGGPVHEGEDRWLLLGTRAELDRLVREHLCADSMWEGPEALLRVRQATGLK